MSVRVPAGFRTRSPPRPARKGGARFDGSQRLAGIGRRVGDGGGEIGRVGRDMIECAQRNGQRPGKVVNDRSYAIGDAVQRGIAFGKRRLPAAARCPRRGSPARGWRCKAPRRRRRHRDRGRGYRTRIDRGGQQHGIDRHPITPPRLQQTDAPPSSGVFGQGRFSMLRGTDHLTHRVATPGFRGGLSFDHATVVPSKAGARLPAWSRCCRCAPDDMARVDRESWCASFAGALIPELANHLVGPGGKRMRPLPRVAAARLCGHAGDDDRHIRLATCVEFHHSATLLHDDVVDSARCAAAGDRQTRYGATRPRCGRRFPVPRAP